MKHIFVIIISLFLSFSVSSADLSDKERGFLISELPNMLKLEWDQPEVMACWRSGTSGNDRALSALYVMNKSISEVTKNANETEAFLKENQTADGFKGRISELLKKRDYNKLKQIVTLLPKAISYCESLMNSSEKSEFEKRGGTQNIGIY